MCNAGCQKTDVRAKQWCPHHDSVSGGRMVMCSFLNRKLFKAIWFWSKFSFMYLYISAYIVFHNCIFDIHCSYLSLFFKRNVLFTIDYFTCFAQEEVNASPDFSSWWFHKTLTSCTVVLNLMLNWAIKSFWTWSSWHWVEESPWFFSLAARLYKA